MQAQCVPLTTNELQVIMKILIPTDYSKNAFQAFKYAQILYPENTTEFIFLNVQNARHAGAILTLDINEDLVKSSRAKMNQLIEEINLSYPATRVNGIVTAGTFLDSVLEKGDEFSIDLIAIGTKGASGIREVLLGSNAADLIGHANRPLIVVPEKALLRTPKKVLLAADFAKDLSPETHDDLLDICYKNNAHLSILHVAKPNEPHFKITDIPFTTEGLDYTLNERIDMDVEFAIIDFVSQNEMDLICTIRSKGGFIHDLFHTSLTKKLGMHVETPMLVLVDQNR